MKTFWMITGFAAMVIAMSCNSTSRKPGRAYMPDMAYSRAYETYSSTENLEKEGILYTAKPVTGTVARGDMAEYTLKNDSLGYAQSAGIRNPFDSLATDMKEAERLYLVNCAICHGPKLDGNGPLWKGGDGPYPAAPKNFMAEDMKTMKEGTMFHSVTYGKGQMGSYASQLSTKQRWLIIKYIKEKQGGTGGSAAATTNADSTAKTEAGTSAKAK